MLCFGPRRSRAYVDPDYYVGSWIDVITHFVNNIICLLAAVLRQ